MKKKLGIILLATSFVWGLFIPIHPQEKLPTQQLMEQHGG
ncbi:hypothetical protein JOD82_000697 [Paenibacillus sp. 1182]|nr:hypothetical protein [Paenibacillus sp. 1182]